MSNILNAINVLVLTALLNAHKNSKYVTRFFVGWVRAPKQNRRNFGPNAGCRGQHDVGWGGGMACLMLDKVSVQR